MNTQANLTERAATGAESARRVIDLLFAFTKEPVSSVRELSDATGIPTPTVHRYVSMLREQALLEEVSRGRYRLSMRVAHLHQAARSATTLIDLVSPALEELARTINETVLLVQPIGDLLVCTHRVEVHRHLRLSLAVGETMPRIRGASSRLHIGYLPEGEQRAYVERAIDQGATPAHIDIEEFLESCREDVAHGVARSTQEIEEGLSAIACPIVSQRELVAVVSVPILSARLDADREEELVAAIRETVTTLSSLPFGVGTEG